MAGMFENLMNRGATPALQAAWSYTQARHRMIAENVANMSTPNYKAKHLDLGEFQQTLAKALKNRGSDPNKALELDGKQVKTRDDGSLDITPATKPGENVLFHDGTNMSIEREMSDLAQNAMLHEVTTTLLKGRFDGLRKAIAGRV
ncbi:MAG: flagellar basal body rod protein FlgB [Phycisphaerales bacterium]|nr:flagellar basal body rod protein FlgB [Phycisphaerales bacterium]